MVLPRIGTSRKRRREGVITRSFGGGQRSDLESELTTLRRASDCYPQRTRRRARRQPLDEPAPVDHTHTQFGYGYAQYGFKRPARLRSLPVPRGASFANSFTIKHFVDSRPKYSDAREPALAWYRQVLRADWASPAEVKRDIGSASILKDGRVVFNIGGNKYRIVVWINYPYRIIYVRFIGTHSEYDRIDAQTV